MIKKHLFSTLLLSIFVASSITACSPDNSEKEKVVTRVQGKTMGTFYGVIVPGGYSKGSEALKNLAEGQFNYISKMISSFDPTSEIARFNEHKSTDPFPISDELGMIIQECDHQSRRIDGAMDITVGPLVNLWGFGKDKSRQTPPTQEEIDEVKKLIGFDSYRIRNTPNGTLLVKNDPNMRIDLSTVGEGLGADAVAVKLIKEGVKDFFVNVAGASRSRGYNPNGKLWKIGIEDPTKPDHSVFVAVCPLDQAMSTAGSYRNFFKDEKTGKFYSHVIDPKTGRPVDHNTVSVTVIARNALVTDALDTGLLVWGADKALAWAEKYQIPVYTIEYKDGKAVGRYSRAFEPYLKCGQK